MKKYGHSKTYGAYSKGKSGKHMSKKGWLKSFQAKHNIK